MIPILEVPNIKINFVIQALLDAESPCFRMRTDVESSILGFINFQA